jgi:hypothetical protein
MRPGPNGTNEEPTTWNPNPNRTVNKNQEPGTGNEELRGRPPSDRHEREPDWRRNEAFERQCPGRHEGFEDSNLRGAVQRGSRHVRTEHPSEEAERVRVPQRHQLDAGVRERLGERAFRIPAMMAERRIERPVGRLYCGNEDEDVPAGDDDVPERAQRRYVIFDVLEHVDAEHRVETMAGELDAIAFFEVTRAELEARVIAQRPARNRHAGGVRLDGHDRFSDLDQPTAHRADAAPHFQHAHADMIAEEVEDVSGVAPRRLHDLEIVGGVAVLGLAVSAVDRCHLVMGPRHRTTGTRALQT